ncbi:hypothetical protein AAFC00_007050 [Neodothiora populina]|uniref:WLM domain-containing protein n=1 Tax=Neodothiora populina TaxID=2781224 RepID=A0ABR3PCL2_9PEZI
MHPSRHTSQWATGPSTHSKTYASSLQETDALFHSYEHLRGVPSHEEGLDRLRKIASMVKPIMRKRGWQVSVLTEFLPENANLLGLNINRGYKICVRLRYNHALGTFLPFEQTLDTMLHELSHIVWGAHDANFHALWDELRNEHETLLTRGYTGEGFLSKGSRLGGGRVPPHSELRRLARANAEKRRVLQKSSGQRVGGAPLHRGSDTRQVIAEAAQRRNTIDRGCASGTADAGRIADHASHQTFKTKAEEDDANDRAIAEALLELMEEDEMKKTIGTFTSPPSEGGLSWHPDRGLYSEVDSRPDSTMTEEEQMKWALQESIKSGQASPIDTHPSQHQPDNSKRMSSRLIHRPDLPAAKRSKSRIDTSNVLRFRNPDVLQEKSSPADAQPDLIDLTDEQDSTPQSAGTTDTWTCEICTCINPLQFLACDACTVERPIYLSKKTAPPAVRMKPVAQTQKTPQSKEELGWYCRECATFMEHKWWTCSGCGLMKDTS